MEGCYWWFLHFGHLVVGVAAVADIEEVEVGAAYVASDALGPRTQAVQAAYDASADTATADVADSYKPWSIDNLLGWMITHLDMC